MFAEEVDKLEEIGGESALEVWYIYNWRMEYVQISSRVYRWMIKMREKGHLVIIENQW